MSFVLFIIAIISYNIFKSKKYKELEAEVFGVLGFSDWNVVECVDEAVRVKSRQTLEKYDDVKFFKENPGKLEDAERIIKRKTEVWDIVQNFKQGNDFEKRFQYKKIKRHLEELSFNAAAYRVEIVYISSAGNQLGDKTLTLSKADINRFRKDPSLLMTKTEYNKMIKEQQKAALEKKHCDYYDMVNKLIDYANKNREILTIKGDAERLEDLMGKLFDRTVNSIKKIKTTDSEEWQIIGDFINTIKKDAEQIVDKNQKIIKYYESEDFANIKNTCEVLMSTQREFNEYITEKVESISKLFGTRIVRNETVNNDEYNYIRPYKKTITPFTAEVSATVFASAENNPMDYIVKYFYPNKKSYPEQIQNLYKLVEELETLKDAKQIIENYKADYQQYLGDVPAYVMEEDEEGFYSRLGFANIDESVLTVEYKFAYTSSGGLAQRSFTVPMTEELIAELIKTLENKLTAAAFVKEQRTLMTKKLRDLIKTRDNFTCCNCGNSTHKEPNLLLEIDHIIPVSKGGYTKEDNLQTLCWKCNRTKSDKIIG